MSVIAINNLSKKNRRQTQLEGIDLQIPEGEIFTLLGEAGSGKTSLARLLMNFIKPSQGEARILDMDTVKQAKEIKAFTSYVPEEVWIYDRLKPSAIFKKTLKFHNMKNEDDIGALADYFDLALNEKFIKLDDEDRKKVAFINAVISKPKVLILDEPAKHCSEALVDKFYKHLSYMRAQEGVTILILSENLAQAQVYSDRVGFMEEGRVLGIEDMDAKDNNDKVLKIMDPSFNIQAFEDLGAMQIKDVSGDLAFFYDGYLPALTTLLYQEGIQNYTLEDARLAEKIASFKSPSPGPGGHGEAYRPGQGPIQEETEDVLPPQSRIVEDVFSLDKEDLDSEAQAKTSSLEEDIQESADQDQDLAQDREVPEETIILDKEDFQEEANQSPPVNEDLELDRDQITQVYDPGQVQEGAQEEEEEDL